MYKEEITLTEHPHIVKVNGVCGGRPVIKGTRTPVQAIVEYYRLGMSTEEILTELPYITEAQLHDALSYFHDHKEEILAGIEADQQLIQEHEMETKQREMVGV
jgi:uncharacterized protein (DUF433 family)